jgi:hypothetical protein
LAALGFEPYSVCALPLEPHLSPLLL